MTRGVRSAWFGWIRVILGIVGAPASVWAHSGEILLVRMVLHQNASVTLEATADLAANLPLRGSKNPGEAMGKALRLRLPSGRSWTLDQIGRAKISLRDGFGHEAPVNLEHAGPEGGVPELYTAAWNWRPSESPLRLEVVGESGQTVLFWLASEETGAVLPGWRMLLGGDKTASIQLPVPPSPLRWNWKAAVAVGFAGMGLVLQGALVVRRVRRWRAKA
ncbi:MAG: hypothetical protein RLZZ142_1511 [Verrucomicrobiota bacterium]